MVYERQMRRLAKHMINFYGKLNEVAFLEKNEDSLLVFSSGAVFSVKKCGAGLDPRVEYTIDMDTPFILGGTITKIAASLGGTNPFSLLTFGYSGTGADCYSTFLSTAGFKITNVKDIDPPLKLKSDGTQVRGTIRGESIEWEDGSETPEPRAKNKWWYDIFKLIFGFGRKKRDPEVMRLIRELHDSVGLEIDNQRIPTVEAVRALGETYDSDAFSALLKAQKRTGKFIGMLLDKKTSTDYLYSGMSRQEFEEARESAETYARQVLRECKEALEKCL